MKTVLETFVNIVATVTVGCLVHQGDYGTAAFLTSGFLFTYLQELAYNTRQVVR